MKYHKKYVDEREETEVTKEEARRTLDGWWTEESLEDIFENEKSFRLWTPYAYVWTEAEDGLVPMAGFFGVCE